MKLSRAKTDKADARLIAEYGRLHQPPLWQPPLAFINELQQESSLLEQLLKQRTALGNHQHALLQQPHISEQARQTLTDLLDQLEEQIKQLEESIARKSKVEFAPLLKVLTSIPGIGLKTAIQLLLITNAFQRFDNAKQLSAYVGLAPRLYESGSSVRGKGHLAKLGMGQMRKLLYLCALSASKCNQACQQLYDRLLAKGKAKKLALIAVANKLLKQAFAMANSGEVYSLAKQNLLNN
jgi:transposase